MFFDEKTNEGVSKEKLKLKGMEVSCHIYASKIHIKKYKEKQDL